MRAIALEGQEEVGWVRSRDPAGGRSREMRPRSEIDVLSRQVNQVTPVSPKPVVEVWLERLEPTLGSDFGWVRIGDGVAADRVRAGGPFAPAPERLALGRELIAERRFSEALALGVGGGTALAALAALGRADRPARAGRRRATAGDRRIRGIRHRWSSPAPQLD